MTGAFVYLAAILSMAMVGLVSGSMDAAVLIAYFALGMVTGRLIAWMNRLWPV